MTAEDAVLAADRGAAGVIVSNHGGRQLDGVAATIDARRRRWPRRSETGSRC